MELPFRDIPERATIAGAFACIKALDEDGRVCWYHRYSEDMASAEALGQVQVMKARLLAEVLEEFEKEDDD